jgi:hypothetical protein
MLVVGMYFSPDHQAFIAFDQRRTEWHARCDRFIDQPVRDAAGQQCKNDLAALLATAKANGWDR